jgi:hypothetical protein
MPERPPKTVDKLADHINELESLIDAKKAPATDGRRVPILDDLVEPETASDDEAGAEPAASELENRLLRRVDAELAELAAVIREIIRRCIREELGPGTGQDSRTRQRGSDD